MDDVEITKDVLMRARVEDVERLARALGVTPVQLRDPYAYRLVLCRDVVDAMLAERMRRPE